MKKKFISSALAFVFIGAMASVISAEVTQPYVTVNGQGEVQAKPDRVMLGFGIETKSKNIKEAEQENARLTQSLLLVLKKNGVADKNIRTTYVQLNPRYDYIAGRQQFVEYVANKSFSLELEDIDHYGKVVAAVLE